MIKMQDLAVVKRRIRAIFGTLGAEAFKSLNSAISEAFPGVHVNYQLDQLWHVTFKARSKRFTAENLSSPYFQATEAGAGWAITLSTKSPGTIVGKFSMIRSKALDRVLVWDPQGKKELLETPLPSSRLRRRNPR